MIFDLFKSKKKKETFFDLLSQVNNYQELVGRIGKVQSLVALDRISEARQVMHEAELVLSDYLNKNPHEKRAHMMLALLYVETGLQDQAEPFIQRLLTSSDFELNDEERLILSGQLHNIQRQQPLSQHPCDKPSGFTQIYCCVSCGRLHNFVSMPCPHCDWFPQSVDETARSIILSNTNFDVPTLLLIIREMGKGRLVDDVVPNLGREVESYLEKPIQRADILKIFLLLNQNEHKNHRTLSMVRECGNCGEKILESSAKQCQDCGEMVNWPNAIRALACFDNLLWFFEYRMEVSSNKSFSEFVCVLVLLTNNLLRKQKSPSEKDRQYCLQLLAEISVIYDSNRCVLINTKNPKSLKISFPKENMSKDSENYGQLFF